MSKTRFIAIAVTALLAAPVPTFADPPPWAPAHGYRAKHGHEHEYDRHEHENAAVEVSTGNEIVIDSGNCNRETVGALLGGVVGGVIGSQIGRDQGNAKVGTVAGAIIGVLVGKNIGRQMDDADRHCAAQVLEQAEDGQTVRWRNPESGLAYRLTPTDTFRRDGRVCRRYTTEAESGEGDKKAQAEACRTPEGGWEVIKKARL